MPGSKTRDPNDDALMRWEWEGGAPDTASDRGRAAAASTTAVRSPPTGGDARQEVDPTESGAADV